MTKCKTKEEAIKTCLGCIHRSFNYCNFQHLEINPDVRHICYMAGYSEYPQYWERNPHNDGQCVHHAGAE